MLKVDLTDTHDVFD